MQTAEKAKLLDALNTSESALRNAVADVPNQLSQTRPAPDRWSILENLEHLVVLENLIHGRFVSAPRLPEETYDPTREEAILNRVPNRSVKIKGSETVHPKGQFASVADALAAYRQIRYKLEKLIDDLGPELRRIEMKHPILGTISGYEMLLVVAAHAERHTIQINEAKSILRGQPAWRLSLAVARLLREVIAGPLLKRLPAPDTYNAAAYICILHNKMQTALLPRLQMNSLESPQIGIAAVSIR